MSWWQAAIVGAVIVAFLRFQAYCIHFQVERLLSNHKKLLKIESDLRITAMERDVVLLRAQMETVTAENKLATAELEEARRFYRDPPGIPL